MAVLALMTAFIGLRVRPVAQLAALVVLLIGGNVAETRAGSSR